MPWSTSWSQQRSRSCCRRGDEPSSRRDPADRQADRRHVARRGRARAPHPRAPGCPRRRPASAGRPRRHPRPAGHGPAGGPGRQGTRLSPFLLGLDKTYLATVRFGVATDTLDGDGEVVDHGGGAADPRGPRRGAAPSLTGDPSTQVPPIYTALKRDGQPLYRHARAARRSRRRRRGAWWSAAWTIATRPGASSRRAVGRPAAAPEAGSTPDARGRLLERHLRALAGARPRAGRGHGRPPGRAAAHHRRALRASPAAVPLAAFGPASSPAAGLIPLGAALPHLPRAPAGRARRRQLPAAQRPVRSASGCPRR